MSSSLFVSLKSYMDRRLYKIKGYLHPVDAMLFISISLCQRHNNLLGGVAEIGVFFGRSFCLLAKSIDSGREKALAVDLFDIGINPAGESDQLVSFRNAIKKADISANDCVIHVGDSAFLKPQQVMEEVRQIRLFSVDGGHLRHHVNADSVLVDQVLADYGVVVFDDFCNPEWPEVSLAVFDFLEKQAGRYVAFCISSAKIYVCRSEYFDFYSKCIAEATLWGGVRRRSMRFLGETIFFCKQPLLKRAAYELLARRGLGHLTTWFCNESFAR